ncbi:hypothetical protein [Roseibacillus persicicus]|uniref:hypothetical protein n=1 Tax=Roseibacillus persicicus TaxID=454148 RepID=UPI00280EE80D|nr:hypothetical protein [Roseibacillus persicicus]MDQ8191774.1 hypothetical protein [Roseibacillus persicicus]
MKRSCSLSLLALVSATLLSNCVSYYRLPDGYTGPRATVKDTATQVTPLKAEIFRVQKINGETDGNTPMATPYGGGMGVVLRSSQREIPAGEPITLTIGGGDSYAADGAALIDSMAGKRRKSVSGDIIFIPKADKTYVVKGTTGKDSSSVWLEEEGTQRLVSKKLVGDD